MESVRNVKRRLMEYLFVYGTLLAKAKNEMSVFLESNAELAGTGYFHGKLYTNGQYPAAVLSQSRHNRVYGNIYALHDSEKIFRVLDNYEEVGPHFPQPNEYKRQTVTAFLPGGKELTCWVYLYNHPTDGMMQIPSGDYLGVHNRYIR